MKEGSYSEPSIRRVKCCVFVCLILLFTSHQQSFSYVGTGLPGLLYRTNLAFAFMNKSFATMPRFYAQVICNWGLLINTWEQQRFMFCNIEITHVFSCINICRVPMKLFEHEAVRPSVQTSSEGPAKCKCNETNMCDHYSCIFYLIST